MTAKVISFPEGTMRPHAPHHPGWDAPDCPIRSVIVAHPYGTSRDGYGCDYTGGHCLPDDKCDLRRAKSLDNPILRAIDQLLAGQEQRTKNILDDLNGGVWR